MKTSPMCSSPTSFDALTGGRVADRVNGKSEAFDRAGGLSGRRPTDLHAVAIISKASQASCSESREIPRGSKRRPERPPAGRIACHTKALVDSLGVPL